MELDQGAARNQRMYRDVKKGDRILIPHLPHYGQITLAIASEDWDKGYSFSVFSESNDHGHIFPAEVKKNFQRNNKNIPAALRGTFRNPCRFWRIDHLSRDIELVLDIADIDLGASSSVVDRWQQTIEESLKESNLQKLLKGKAYQNFGKSDWEHLLVSVLQRLNSEWVVKRTGGKAEASHGTDILMKIPDVFGDGYYGIAIQVKDYSGVVGDAPIAQIMKSKGDYWQAKGVKILEMVVILIGGDKFQNSTLEVSAKKNGVRLIWASDVEDLIFRSACRFISGPDGQGVEDPEISYD